MEKYMRWGWGGGEKVEGRSGGKIKHVNIANHVILDDLYQQFLFMPLVYAQFIHFFFFSFMNSYIHCEIFLYNLIIINQLFIPKITFKLYNWIIKGLFSSFVFFFPFYFNIEKIYFKLLNYYRLQINFIIR